MMFARLGTMFCLGCGTEVGAQTRDEIVDQLLALPEGQRIQLLAPAVRDASALQDA